MTAQVLFFGRKKCELTMLAIKYLQILGCDITTVLSEKRGEKLDEELMWWKGDFIVAFRSHLILPEALIKRAQQCAVNFHPGSTEYPGTGCANFALYEDSEMFGVTAHCMTKRVDAGEILGTKRFNVHDNDTVDSLLERTHIHLLSLFYDVAFDLITNGSDAVERRLNENKDSVWSKVKRTAADLDALQVLTGNETVEETKRTIRATHTENFPTELTFNGQRFLLKK
jgi:methionyl-tRNA formyltransferase